MPSGGRASCPFEGNDPQLRWNPSRNQNKFIRFDDYYKYMPQRIIPVLHGCAPMMYTNPADQLIATPPCPPFQGDKAHHSNPRSYLQYAQWISLFAARYGKPPAGGFPAGFEKVAGRYVQSPDNTNWGKGLIDYIEVFNEADRAWHDGLDTEVTEMILDTNPDTPTKYYFRPREYAAMLSAAYDGNVDDPLFDIKDDNNNVIGRWGIHNLSPQTKIVLTGTAETQRDYIELMTNTWDEIRGKGNYPVDVLNYHLYSTKDHPKVGQRNRDNFWKGRKYFGSFGYYDPISNTQQPDNQGIFPEASNIALKERIKYILADKPMGLTDKPVWITEFGYDSFQSQASGVDIEPFGSFDAQTIQGQWISRYILETSTTDVEKLFIYELADDYSGQAQFSHSGLTLPNGSPKKSWFHIMTLLNVLGKQRFDVNTDGGFLHNGNILSENDARVYRYVSDNPNQITYVAWVPKGQDARFDGELLIPNLDINKPSVQKIEVVEWDEDGKRTMIPSQFIEDFIIGTNSFWKIKNYNGQPLTLTETPQYFRINATNAVSDITVPPVSNLTQSCLGCNNMKITWQSSTAYDFYNIYFAEAASYGDPSVFNPARATLYTERLGGHHRSLVVSGLDTGSEYFFWIIPFRRNLPFNATVVPANFEGTLVENQHYIRLTVANCDFAACALPINGASVSNVSPGDSSWVAGNIAHMIALNSNGQVNICDELNSSPDDLNNVGITIFPPNSGVHPPFNQVSFVINLGGTFYIDALNIFHKSGSGVMRLEFLEDCCSDFQFSTSLSLTSFNRWHSIVNHNFNTRKIEKIRVTVSAIDLPLAITRMFFCGRPAADECKDRTPPAPGSQIVADIPDAEAREIDTRSAKIVWSPAIEKAGTAHASAIAHYQIAYGTALDEQGNIVLPVFETAEIPTGQHEGQIWLSSLQPNTTYHADIKIIPGVVPCRENEPNPPGSDATRISFTTKEENIEPRNAPKKSKTAPSDFQIFPNPTRHILNVKIPNESGFHRWVIAHPSGIRVREGRISSQQSHFEIQTSDFPQGSYVLTLFSPHHAPTAKVFVVVK